MRVRVDGETYAGRAVDLSGHDLDPSAVAAALAADAGQVGPIRIECPSSGPVHDRVGVIQPRMSLERRAAMAAAARSLGRTAPHDEEIAAVEAQLDGLDAPRADTSPARRRLAEAGTEQERLRERVARLQGRVRALREAGLETDDAESALADAVHTLSEVETERVAARQALAAARGEARTARDVRERRLELEDRLGNLRRAARAHLADVVRADVDAAVEAAPGRASGLDGAAAHRVALGVVRVAAISAPVVLVEPPFADPETAATWLDAPVLEV